MPTRRLAAVAIAATILLAFLIAAIVKRTPPDFSGLPPIAVVLDGSRHPLWEIRVAPHAREIALDSVGATATPAGRAYQLWLALPDGAHSLGLLPASGRKVTAELPWLMPRFSATGELLVSLEPARGSDLAKPTGPIVFRAAFSAKNPG